MKKFNENEIITKYLEENLKKITIGKREKNLNYDFRETCFGIVVRNEILFCTEKLNELSLIGGGIEKR